MDSALAAGFIQQAREIIDILSAGGTNPGGRPHRRFTAVARQSNGRLRFQFSAEPGPLCILETSANLTDWEMIDTATDNGDGTFEFEDSQAAGFSGRFYHLLSP